MSKWPSIAGCGRNTATPNRKADGMNRRDYRLHLDGYAAAAHGSGLSGSPHGGRDGGLWRSGVRTWLDEHGDETGDQAPDPESGRFGSPARKTALDVAPGAAILTRRL